MSIAVTERSDQESVDQAMKTYMSLSLEVKRMFFMQGNDTGGSVVLCFFLLFSYIILQSFPLILG